MSHLKLFLLGPPRLEREGKPLEINTRKSMALMAYLAVSGQIIKNDSFSSKESRMVMNYQKLLQQIICLNLVVILLAGCGGAQAEPTVTATPVPPTVTPSPVPPTPQPTVEIQEPAEEAVANVESQASLTEPEEPEATVEPPTITLSDGEELVLVAGRYDDPSSRFWRAGYGVEGEAITSPGPTIKMRRGETVTITFENAHYKEDGGPFALHNFSIVADLEVHWMRMEPLWGAHVGGSGDPNLYVGERGSVTFTAEEAGSFFYVCAYADHLDHGMWGRFIVEE